LLGRAHRIDRHQDPAIAVPAEDGGRHLLRIRDVQTGENTGTVPGFEPTRYHPGSHELAAIDDGILAIWSTR
jgi:hypothetical protein